MKAGQNLKHLINRQYLVVRERRRGVVLSTTHVFLDRQCVGLNFEILTFGERDFFGNGLVDKTTYYVDLKLKKH